MSSSLSDSDGTVEWIGCVSGRLYRRLSTDSPGVLSQLDTTTLQVERVVQQRDYGHGVFDGKHPHTLVPMPSGLGCVEAHPKASWKIRSFSMSEDSVMSCVREVAMAPSTRYTRASGKCAWAVTANDRLTLPKNMTRLASTADFAVAVTVTGSVFFTGSCADFKSSTAWLPVAQPVGAFIVDAVIAENAKFAILQAKDGRLYTFGQTLRFTGVEKSSDPRIELLQTPGKYKPVFTDLHNGNIAMLRRGEQVFSVVSTEPVNTKAPSRQRGSAEDSAAEAPMLNVVGNLATVNANGKYYCGGAMGASCSCGSCSKCEPESKCRCQACAPLDIVTASSSSRSESGIVIDGHPHPLIKLSYAKTLKGKEKKIPGPKVDSICHFCKEKQKSDAWVSSILGTSFVVCKKCITPRQRFDMRARSTGFFVPNGHTAVKASGCGLNLLVVTSSGDLLRSGVTQNKEGTSTASSAADGETAGQSGNAESEGDRAGSAAAPTPNEGAVALKPPPAGLFGGPPPISLRKKDASPPVGGSLKTVTIEFDRPTELGFDVGPVKVGRGAGVVVTSVTRDCALRIGDIITTIMENDVKTPSDFEQVIQNLPEGTKKVTMNVKQSFAFGSSSTTRKAPLNPPFGKCASEKHVWSSTGARTCITCKKCTAFGSSCPLASAEPIPYDACGCASTFGASGCVLCGQCQRCATQQDSKKDKKLLEKKGSDHSAWYGQMIQLQLVKDITNVADVASGTQHSLILLKTGDVLAMGSNSYGQLGLGDTDSRRDPVLVKLPAGVKAAQISAGSWHSLVRTEDGQVFSFGRNDCGQLARDALDQDATPAPVTNSNGAAHDVFAGATCSFLTYTEEVASESVLRGCSALHVDNQLILLPTDGQHLLSAELSEGTFSMDRTPESLHDCVVAADYDCGVCWSFNRKTGTISVLSADAAKSSPSSKLPAEIRQRILRSALSPSARLPSTGTQSVSPAHAGTSLLTNLHTMVHGALGVGGTDDSFELNQTKINQEDFLECVRFKSSGGGWGYSGHSVDAIAFRVDQPVLCGGLGVYSCPSASADQISCEATLYAGHTSGGETLAKVTTKFGPPDSGTGSVRYCKVFFDEPVALDEGKEYSAAVRLTTGGQTSNCGSSGTSDVMTPAGVRFTFMSSSYSQNGTDISSGQVPAILFHPSSSPVKATESTSKKTTQRGELHAFVTSSSKEKRVIINGRTIRTTLEGATLLAVIDPDVPYRISSKVFAGKDEAGVARFVRDVPEGHVVCCAGTVSLSQDPDVKAAFTPAASTPLSLQDGRGSPTFEDTVATPDSSRAFIAIKGDVVLSEETGKSGHDLVEAHHKLSCSITPDNDGVSVRRILSYLSPDALQALLDLVDWAKRGVAGGQDEGAFVEEESMMLVAATSMRLAKSQILACVLLS